MDTKMMPFISQQFATNTHEPGAVNPLHLLVVRAAAADKQAIDALARTYGPLLLAIADLALDDFADEAEDVVQDFYLLLLEGSIRTCPTPESAMRWMVEAVKGLARDRREAAMRRWGVEPGP